MYPVLFMIVTAALIASLYRELRDIFGAPQRDNAEEMQSWILDRPSGRASTV